ncbi:integrase, catalytic region, zinc finger, CCHC-type containing protein [Tanacetum coccineum]|uniref:Integrase, catalytic region, zinc finger, CCHC-type containing protein n=1 Tax=Tanacetum coccineum TaxID=301880 RepID=A0ABQ5IND2_9ASTR
MGSRFKRFLDNKLEKRERMWRLIEKGPYVRPMIPDSDDTREQIIEPLSKMTEINKKQYIANVRVMNYLLQAIPNDIYNSVDACKTAQEMWERIKRLIYGFDVTNHVRHSRLMDEFDKFATKEGESLESVYERLTTLVNIIDRNNVRPITVSTKFLNRLQPEWVKYVTMVRHNQTGDTVSYDQLPIRRIQDFDEFKDHCMTLKNTPYPHQRYAVYNTLVDKEEPIGFTTNTPYPSRRYGVKHQKILKDINSGPYSKKSPIRYEILQTVDACLTPQELWEAIRKAKQGGITHMQDVKDKLILEFGHSPLTMEKQLKWSRFVTIVKQQHKLDEVSYHKLFDILKQYQKEVNELRAERMAKNANPLALLSLPTRSHATTRYKGKEIAKPITPPSESASEEDSDPEQAQRDKDMQKNLALIAKYFKKIYKPTNNNLRTSSNTRNKNMSTTPRETVGGQVVQQSGIQCFNCKEFGHYAKECRKPKRVKDSTYHRKMLLYDQNDVKCDDERVSLGNLIANLKLDVDENKKIKKQLKKANATLTQELTECKSILTETSRTLGESNSFRDSCLVALQNKQTEFERYKAFNDRTVDYDKLERKLNDTLGLLA